MLHFGKIEIALKLLCVCRMTIEAKDIVINQCCWLTSLTGCECAVCIVCNITASVARRRAAACMVTIWWSSVPRWTGPLSSLCLIVIPWCPHPHTATPSPEQRFLPASRHQSRRGSARRLGKPKWTEKLDPDCRHRVTSDIWGLAPSWHSTAVVCPPLAPAVYWKNVNYEFFTSLVTRWCPADRKYPTLCDGVSQVSAIQCPQRNVAVRKIIRTLYQKYFFFNKLSFLPDVASHYSSPIASDKL